MPGYCWQSRLVYGSGRLGRIGSLHHVHENAQHLPSTVVFFQVDVHRVTYKLQKFPDAPRRHNPIHRGHVLTFLGMKEACSQHCGDTLPDSSFDIFIFRFNNNNGRCTDKQLLRGAGPENKLI